MVKTLKRFLNNINQSNYYSENNFNNYIEIESPNEENSSNNENIASFTPTNYNHEFVDDDLSQELYDDSIYFISTKKKYEWI